MPVTRSVRLHARSPALALLALAVPARAETVPFVFDRAIYPDEKEVALVAPEGVACNDAGDVVVADTGNGRLVLYRYVGGSLTGGTRVKPAGLAYPVRVQFDSKGNILVLDRKARKILRLDSDGRGAGHHRAEGRRVDRRASLPVAFKLDGADNVYVLDGVGRRLVVFDPAGTVTRQVDLPEGQGLHRRPRGRRRNRLRRGRLGGGDLGRWRRRARPSRPSPRA